MNRQNETGALLHEERQNVIQIGQSVKRLQTICGESLMSTSIADKL